MPKHVAVPKIRYMNAAL